MKKYLFLVFFLFLTGCSNAKLMENYIGKNKNVIKENYEFIYADSEKPFNEIIAQNIPYNKEKNKKIILTVSNGKLLYEKLNVNELGKIPVMMYHGIVDTLETEYIGGNVDKSGYHRTAKAFREDLDFYYKSGYRMIKLNDYVNGKIDVELGKSPIVLTFDDGIANNFKVLEEKNGELVIDPNCAVGILEEFKKNYPDFNVTATFMLNGSLFFQNKYNEKILNWLIDNGYDVGNHTYSHFNLADLTYDEVLSEVNKMYDILDKNIGDKFVKIVSLPFGSPYKKDHANFNAIMENSISTLRVGWESDFSPFHKNFDKTFIKRIRAYDNEGKDFDIKYEFDRLLKSRFISDGDSTKITINIINKDFIKSDLIYESYGG